MPKSGRADGLGTPKLSGLKKVGHPPIVIGDRMGPRVRPRSLWRSAPTSDIIKCGLDFKAYCAYDVVAMKSILLAVVLLAVSVHSLEGQSRRTTLDLGTVTVWIGIPKQEVLSKFAIAGYKLLSTSAEDTADGKLILVNAGDTIYDVAFTAGRLTFAERGWYTKNVSVEDAVIDSLTAVAGTSGTLCKVTPDTLSSPGSSSKRVFVSCGSRTILIMKTKLDKSEYVSVSERIGEYYSQKE